MPSGSDYLNGIIPSVVVTENQTTAASVALQHGAKIHISFVDAATNAPVTGACVGMVDDNAHNWVSPYFCTGADTYDFAGWAPSSFRIFVASGDGVHGAQWVGATGGTGDPDAATVSRDQTPSRLRALGASFVTLEARGRLRGCIAVRSDVRPGS